MSWTGIDKLSKFLHIACTSPYECIWHDMTSRLSEHKQGWPRFTMPLYRLKLGDKEIEREGGGKGENDDPSAFSYCSQVCH